MSRAEVSVLVVEDEPVIGEVIGRYLRRAGYDVRHATDGAGALQLHDQRPADLFVLDVALPVVDGLEVLRRLRTVSMAAPRVILVTGRDAEQDRIAGLRAGADDYVVKPFSPREIVARVDAVLRRRQTAAPAAAPATIHAGELVIDLAGRRVFRSGEMIELTPKEYDLLAFLASNPNIVHSRDQLMSAVWGYDDYADTSTVTVHVRRLRRKIERLPTEPEFIHTAWGLGYRFGST